MQSRGTLSRLKTQTQNAANRNFTIVSMLMRGHAPWEEYRIISYKRYTMILDVLRESVPVPLCEPSNFWRL